MDKTEVARKVVSLPNMFNNLGNVSMYDLLKETGYFQIYDQVSEKVLRDEINRYPQCIDEWLLYSENKRSDTGYYIKKNNENSYIVGYLNPKDIRHNGIEYNETSDACAVFIKHEIEDIRLGSSYEPNVI